MDQLEVLKLWQQVKTALTAKYPDLKTTFGALDTNSTGMIEIDDLTNELKDSYNQQQIQQLFEFLNVSGSGQCTIEELEQRWAQSDQLVTQKTNQLQFLQQKEKRESQEPREQNSAKFSDLFQSSLASNSPNKKLSTLDNIYIQGEPLRTTYDSQRTPPRESRKSALRLSPVKSLETRGRLEVKLDKLAQVQRQITRLFNSKPTYEKKPTLKRDFESFVRMIGLGQKSKQSVPVQMHTNQRLSSGFNVNLSVNVNRPVFNRSISPKRQQLDKRGSMDMVSLDNYRYQFHNGKTSHRVTKTMRW